MLQTQVLFFHFTHLNLNVNHKHQYITIPTFNPSESNSQDIPRVSVSYDVTEFSSHLHILRFYATMVQSQFTMLANLGPKNICHSMKMALLQVHNYISMKSTMVFGWIGYQTQLCHYCTQHALVNKKIRKYHKIVQGKILSLLPKSMWKVKI